MIQALSPNRADDSLDVRILPRGLRRGTKGSDAQIGQHLGKVGSIGGVQISQQESWRGCSTAEGDSDLARQSIVRWIRDDSEMQDLATIMGKDHEYVQNPKGKSLDSEQVAGRDLTRMVSQESRRALAATGSWPVNHVLGNGGLGKIMAEQSQLELQPRCSPEAILI